MLLIQYLQFVDLSMEIFSIGRFGNYCYPARGSVQ